VANSSFAQKVVEHFATHGIVQSDGLDEAGTHTSADKTVAVEMIIGKKEEIYWEKVPAKVREQAVQRAMVGEYETSDEVWNKRQRTL
jgi:xRRM domain